MFILKKGHQPGIYVPLRALFLVWSRYSDIIPLLTITVRVGGGGHCLLPFFIIAF